MVQGPMRSGLISVTPAELTGLASQLKVGAETIDSTLSRLATQVNALRNDWLGKGRARFDLDWQQWQSSAGQLRQALEDIATLLGQAAVEYQNSDDQVAARLAGHTRG